MAKPASALPPTVTPGLPELSVGDRAPNFALPDANGEYFMLYNEVKGGPVVLLFLDSTDERQLAVLPAFDAPGFQAVGAHVFGILRHSPDAKSAPEVGFPVLSDTHGKITDAYFQAAGIGPAANGAAAIALDPNQRVLAVTSGATGVPVDLGPYLYGATLDALNRWHREITPVIHTETAPVLIVPELLDRETCAQLIEQWESDHSEGTVYSTAADAKDGEKISKAMKSRLDHTMESPELKRRLAQLLGRRIGPEINRAHHYQGFRFDSFKVVCYDAERGDLFAPHRDNAMPGNANRMFALSLNLNDDFEGGNVRFPEYGPHEYRPPAGGGLIFSCSLLHEALPVTRGKRFALLTFLRSLDRPPQGQPAR